MEILNILDRLAENCDIKFEVIAGKIVPKETSEPLPTEILELLLEKENENFDKLFHLTLLLMPSRNHREIIATLNQIIHSQLNCTEFNLYIQDMKIKTKLLGTFLVPDLTFTLHGKALYDNNDLLENPVSIIEVLSPSTEKKDRNEKAEAYKSIESLQEYVLIAQDSYKIEQYLRKGKTKWTVKIYDSENDTCILTVGVKIKLNELYQNTDWANQ
jgi:Uma2 family endonuclease